MRHHTTPPGTRDVRHLGTNKYARLYDLSDYRVAHGDPDVRGWNVITVDGQKAGRVDSLIVDTDALEVRFLDVELDRKTHHLDEERHVLVPLAEARLDDPHDQVLLDSLTAADVATMPVYHPGQPIELDTAPPHKQADIVQFYGTRGGTGAVQRIEAP